ncbi:MAG: glycosyl hydrolase family 28-related protein [Bacteroidota bacterium]
MRLLLFLFLLLSISLSSFAQNEPAWFNVMDYGATADTSALSTDAFQQALDAARKAGGGTVYVPPGNFLCGSIRLYSYTTLHVEGGATVWASRRKEDYTLFGSKAKQPVLLYADSAHHISLIGKGRLHGQARRVYKDLKQVDGFIAKETAQAKAYGVEMKMYYKVAPWVTPVFFYHSTDITLEDISIIEGGFWLLDIKQCDRIFIRGAYLESSLDQGVNADGIDIDGCRDVVISDCIVITGDDAIVLKANYAKDANYHTENVTVTNCVVTSTSTGLKLGTESYGDYRHITFNNCVVRNSNRGLSIVVRDGGTVENVIFSNITIETNRKHFNWWGDGDPIWVVLRKRRDNSDLGHIKNVLFENIIAHGEGTSKIEGYAPNEMHPEGGYLENIRLHNVQLTTYPETKPDLRATHGFEAHHVRGLHLDQVEIQWAGQPQNTWQSGIKIHESSELRLRRLRVAPGLQGSPAIHLHQTQNVLVQDVEALPGTLRLLELSGDRSKQFVLKDLDLMETADQVLKVRAEIAREEIRRR